jgi:hypothetical protein
MGDGSAPRSLSRLPALGARSAADSPTLFPTASGVFRPHSRAVQQLMLAEVRVRPLSSLRLVVAPPACEPGQDTFVTWRPRLDRQAPGRPPLLAMRWPGATGLDSYLSGCLSLTSQRCSFRTSPTFWKGFQAGPRPVRLPGLEPLCPPFGVFGLANS